LSLERKLVAGVLVLFLVPAVVAGVVLVAMYRAGTLATPSTIVATVVVGFVALMGYLGVVAHGLGRSLVRQLREIQLGAELMATVNPAHRLQVRAGDELEAVAQEINRLADRLQEARTGLEAEVIRATRLVEVERGKLSAVLESLGEAVAVASLEGRVILANPAAHDLLGAAPGGLLGRSLFDFVDREKVAHFQQRLGAGRGGVERFSLPAAAGSIIQVVMTPFFDGDGQLVGFALVFRDVTRPARSDEERHHRLADIVRGLRGPLASIRSLSESLLGDPASVAAGSRRLLAAVHAETLRLSELVTAASAADRLGLVDTPQHFEKLAVGDLLAMAVRRLAPVALPAVSVEVADPALPPLRTEASAFSGALAHLLGAVLRHRQPGAPVWLRPRRHGRVLQIDAGAEGQGTIADLEAVLDVLIPLGTTGQVTAREVFRRHAGEVWAYREEDRLGFRLTLPLEEDLSSPDGAPGEALAPAGFAGAGLLSGFSAGEPVPGRPDFYDFSLIEAMERRVSSADRERLLAELTCVVFDTETTGLEPSKGDAIVSLAAVCVRAGVVKRGEIFDVLVNPGRPIPLASTRFHAITDAMVGQAPPIDVVLPAFLRFAEGAVLVGHQVWFDLRFLDIAGARLGLLPLALQHAVLDTLTLSEIVHGALDEHGLDAIAIRLGVAVRGRHSALGDAQVTAEILVRLLGLLDKRGIRTLGQVLEAARRSRRFGASPTTAGPRP
jgi:DNA polymerase-3 subunit epsilon